ncbi:TIGR03943 family protein [Microbacteriaceae bacterium VKM Ac-2854]|nr:TIGR03943 family protein [Microbacteriaceae bacterium VKM Ac-2854]
MSDAFSRLVRRWQGVLLSLVGVAATLWLGATGRLGLYIHPRYFVFTMVLALIAAVILIAAFAVLPDEHEHDQKRSVWPAVGGAAIVLGSVAALLVVPPATLTTATAAQREVNTSAVDASVAAAAPTGDYADFTVRDWATLLRQGASEQFLADKTAAVSGFVTPDARDPDNVFYVARFVVTCCAVDAQPVGVPIHQPGWQDVYAVDSWLEVSGGFGSNPSVLSTEPIVLVPDTVTAIDEPAMPYVY